MSKVEKQTYLRQKIKDRGYDTDKFIKYLEKTTEQSPELENFTLEVLKTTAKAFIKKEKEEGENDSVSSVSSGADEEVFGKKQANDNSSSSDSSDEEQADYDIMDELTGAFDVEEPVSAPKEEVKATPAPVVGEVDGVDHEHLGEPKAKKKNYKVRKTCPTLEKTVLVDCEQLRFTISKPMIIKGGLFK